MRHPKEPYIISDDAPTLFELWKNTKGLYIVNCEIGFFYKKPQKHTEETRYKISKIYNVD